MRPADNDNDRLKKDKSVGDAFSTDIFVHSSFSQLDDRDALHPGYVYVVGFDNYVKIGFTRNFAGRRANLQGGVPIYLCTLNVFVGNKRDESALMDYFAAQSTGHGEWFHYEGPLAEWIDAGLPYALFEAVTERKAA